MRLILLLLAMLAVAPPLFAQRAVYQTSNDNRRVPLPPIDQSKAQPIAIRGGTLIDGRGGRALADSVVVLQGDRIVAVGPAATTPIPSGARILEAAGMTVMPGLIDLHIHFTQQRGHDLGLYSDSDAAMAIRGVALADQLVSAGITAARDVGTSNDVALRIKEGVARGIIRGPRVLWSGKIIASRGGHGDEITSTGNGRPRGDSNARTRVANGPWDWRLAVREQMRAHADWIKVSAPFAQEEIAAAIEEAHMQGMGVAIDSFGEFTDMAIAAGVDTLEHPLKMSSQSVALMKRHGTAFVPTIGAFHNLLTTGYTSASIPAGGFYFTHSRRFAIDQQEHLGKVSEAWRAGVPIGVGTDIPFENDVRYPDAYFRELDYLAEAGMPNSAILASATAVGAKILKMDDKLGSIVPGMLADIIVLRADPLADLKALRDPRWVIANGKLVIGD